MKFPDVLAQSIHDIKNSLAMILNGVDDLLTQSPECIKDQQAARLLQYEAKRANNNLVQLLSLYKLDEQRLSVNVTEHNLAEFLEDLVAENQAVCEALNVSLAWDCDEWLTGYFDDDLVRGVIGSTIGNAQRYAKHGVRLNAEQEAGWLVIRVDDDGLGYPSEMLNGFEPNNTAATAGFRTGRTHLGLYFANTVAQLHVSGERCGRVVLRNGYRTSGGCFELWLP